MANYAYGNSRFLLLVSLRNLSMQIISELYAHSNFFNLRIDEYHAFEL